MAEKVRKALEDNQHFKVGQVTGSFGVAERMKAEFGINELIMLYIKLKIPEEIEWWIAIKLISR